MVFLIHLPTFFFQNLIGEWAPVEGSEIQGPPKDNAVLGHIIHRLFNIVSPPEVSKVPSIKPASKPFHQYGVTS